MEHLACVADVSKNLREENEHPSPLLSNFLLTPGSRAPSLARFFLFDLRLEKERKRLLRSLWSTRRHKLICLNLNIVNFPVFACLFFESQCSFFAVFSCMPCNNIPETQQLLNTTLSQLKRDSCTIGFLRNRKDIPS